MKKTIFIPRLFILVVLIVSLSLTSCDEGIFNFNDETGNISINLTADSSVGTNLGEVVFTLENDETDDYLEKSVEIEDKGGKQEASLYLSRINTGYWKLIAEIYDENRNILTTEEHEWGFELELGQTVIADLEYWGGNELDMVLDVPAGTELESMVQIDELDTIITGIHNAPAALDSTHFASVMIARGAGFDSGLAGLRTDYPDGSFFEFSTSSGRSIADLEVDVQNDLVSISRAGASSTGDYSLTVTDLNDVEIKEVDNCWFEAPLDTGFISFGGADYGGGDVLETMWELNDAPSNGSVIAYYVDRNDGTDVSENTFALNVWDIGTLNPTMDDFSFAGPPPIADDDQIVIVTFDIDSVTADDVFNNAGDPSYVQGSTNLSLSNLPGWLYFSFGEDLNYIGISVWDYNS